MACRLRHSIREERPLADAPEDETDTGRQQAELAKAVVSYLGEHPQAMDSPQGIAEWWGMPQSVNLDIDTLVGALEQLVDGGLLERIDSTEGPLYRLRRY